jgi:Na+/H+ antiporter NhaD/arsenite permease-like protein
MSEPTIRLAILAITYVLIAVQQLPGVRVNRPAASLLGAVAMVTIGGLDLHDAYAAIDLDVIVFLLGVLLLTGYLELGGFFEWAAERVLERTTSPRGLLAATVGLGGVLSALFINDTICLVLTPLVIVMLRPLGVSPLPYLLAIALASNVGSAMTLTGNPQNMLIGVSSGIEYARFTAMLALPSVGGLVIVHVVVAWIFRRELAVPFPRRVDTPPIDFDRALVTKALVIFGGALVGWLAGGSLPLIAIAAGALMVAVAGRDPAEAFAKVEWSLLLFFAALFVVMDGVRDLPLVVSLTSSAAGHLVGEPLRDAAVIGGAMLALSNVVSNVPAVVLWLPVVPTLPNAELAWMVMAMASTFAGNLTLLGSMANLIVAERANARGVTLRFRDYLKVGVPVTVLTMLWGIVTLVLFGR